MTKPGPKPSAPCGSVSAFKRHKRNHEPVDVACRLAWNEANRLAYARRGGRKAKVTK